MEEIEKNEENIHVIFSVFERPSGFDDETVVRSRWRLLLRKKTGCREGRENAAEKEVGLLVSYLIRKRNWRGEREIDAALSGKLGVEHFWAVLEECLLDILSVRWEKQGEGSQERNDEVCHLKNDSIALSKRKTEKKSFVK
jgi:hypothetical protein